MEKKLGIFKVSKLKGGCMYKKVLALLVIGSFMFSNVCFAMPSAATAVNATVDNIAMQSMFDGNPVSAAQVQAVLQLMSQRAVQAGDVPNLGALADMYTAIAAEIGDPGIISQAKAFADSVKSQENEPVNYDAKLGIIEITKKDGKKIAFSEKDGKLVQGNTLKNVSDKLKGDVSSVGKGENLAENREKMVKDSTPADYLKGDAEIAKEFIIPDSPEAAKAAAEEALNDVKKYNVGLSNVIFNSKDDYSMNGRQGDDLVIGVEVNDEFDRRINAAAQDEQAIKLLKAARGILLGHEASAEIADKDHDLEIDRQIVVYGPELVALLTDVLKTVKNNKVAELALNINADKLAKEVVDTVAPKDAVSVRKDATPKQLETVAE